MSRYRLTFITPLFSRGAFEDPEIRPASIRGQLHWWFRATGGRYAGEKAVFGGVHNGAAASRVMVRCGSVEGKVAEARTLPHKSGGMAAARQAFAPGTSFDLHIMTRLGGFVSSENEAQFNRALEAWLLMGTLGLRATRGAGSFMWEPLDGGFTCPSSMEDYTSRCAKILSGTPTRFALLSTVYNDAEDARKVVSDTIGGRDDDGGQDDLARLHYPLGRIRNGRKTSPLRFRIVCIGGQSRIAAIWDGRSEVTGNTDGDLAGVVRLLAERKPELGDQLRKILA